MRIGFIGTGRIASSVITGICKSSIKYEKIIISSRNKSISNKLKKNFKRISIEKDNQKIIDKSNWIFLCVTPIVGKKIIKKGPVPIFPPNKKVKNFFDKIGFTIEIKSEKLSTNFWSVSGMMASYYEMLKVMSNWLVKKGINRYDAQKYITSLFLALSEDAFVNSKKELKYLVKDSQTPKGLNEQGLKEMSKQKVYNHIVKTLNSIHKRLNK